MADLHQRIANDVPKIKRGKVWCIQCKRMKLVDGAECLRLANDEFVEHCTMIVVNAIARLRLRTRPTGPP